MGQHRAKKPDVPASSGGSHRIDGASSAPALSPKKLLIFRLLAVVGVPVVFACAVELILRLSGYGYTTAFLLKASQNRREVFIPNNQFGWRFFGREMARWPYPFSVSQIKATNTIRIFVLGESAARGEPQPEFGVSRFLQVLLSAKYPSTRFEVVNVAMTAINSHTILPIARDCAQADGDIWVIYMGNNEVVGPFGAGTVFGPQTPSLSLIRSSLAIKTTRTGQLMDSMMRGMQASRSDESVWGGMTLFLDQQVRSDDPRMGQVRQHFEQNLSDIIRTGQRSGASIVLSTVAVNLKECPPFASLHRSGISEQDKARWQQFYQDGIVAQDGSRHQEAAAHFQEAARLDDTFAELRFRQGQCAIELGDVAGARRHFVAARDLDTLRFRCDSELNYLIRKAGTNRELSRVYFADAEQSFADNSIGGLPGGELFFEHVHFTPAGSYLLGRTIAGQVANALPLGVAATTDTNQPWISAAECERRLALTDWSRIAGLNSIVATLNDPPFTAQLGHEARMKQLDATLGNLSAAMRPVGVRAAMTLCEAAIKATPEDAPLHAQLAALMRAAGDLTGAEAAARRELELLPNDQEGWSQLGLILAQQNKLDEAAVTFEHAFRLGPQGIKSMLNLAGALAGLGKTDAALAEYQRVLRRKPRNVPALLQTGQLMEKLGRKAEAENYFNQALTNRSQRLPELTELGVFFQTRGDFASAVKVFNDAVRLSPADARLQLSVGRNLASLARFEAAAEFSAEAVRLSPEFVEAHLLHGIVLLRRGQAEGAREQFEIALRLRPDSMDAKLNLAVTFAQTGRNEEALKLFDEVLKQSPTNITALKFSRTLRSTVVNPVTPTNNPATR